mgnify:CR=1 FL=1
MKVSAIWIEEEKLHPRLKNIIFEFKKRRKNVIEEEVKVELSFQERSWKLKEYRKLFEKSINR